VGTIGSPLVSALATPQFKTATAAVVAKLSAGHSYALSRASMVLDAAAAAAKSQA